MAANGMLLKHHSVMATASASEKANGILNMARVMKLIPNTISIAWYCVLIGRHPLLVASGLESFPIRKETSKDRRSEREDTGTLATNRKWENEWATGP